MKQTILSPDNNYQSLTEFLKENRINKVFLVCGKSFFKLKISTYFQQMLENGDISIFSDFESNPSYESVVKGVQYFKESGSDAIIAVGGGSAIDVAKCIKLFSNMENDSCYLKQEIISNEIPFIAVPTTAGTGSEATRFAVIYYNGEKQSISDESLIPSAIILDPELLFSLPSYQRKVTMMDALCHAIESYWSIHSTEMSKQYSASAIDLILEYENEYLDNHIVGNKKMLEAAYQAGKAINITQTTAGHAMCYKLTTLYHIAHGHAVALCVSELWEYMLEHIELCCDSRGTKYFKHMFLELAQIMGCASAKEAVGLFKNIVKRLQLASPSGADEQQIKILTKSVNPVRLKNHPIILQENEIEKLYRKILLK